jgi:hypothetical protein
LKLINVQFIQEKPNIVRLTVHLPGQHSVTFDPDVAEHEDVAERVANPKTTLTEFFKANKAEAEQALQHPDNPTTTARRCLYQEFPQHFTWASKKWKLRQHGFAIGRMYYVPPSAGEKFYLWLLLTVVRGATSFEDLRTVDGTEHLTFKAACLSRGLLQDDQELKDSLTEASVIKTGFQLRQLFCLILLECNPTDPVALWEQFREHICDDLKHRLQTNFQLQVPSENDIYDYGLYLIDRDMPLDKNLISKGFPPLPNSNYPYQVLRWSSVEGNHFIAEQLNYGHTEQRQLADERYTKLNADQKAAFDQILQSIMNNNPKVLC